MGIAAFPIAKLGALLVKHISKPIANACKARAKHHPFFRTYVCMPPAQFYNWCEVKSKLWILNLGRPVNIPVLSQEMAIELGANILGETLVFTMGAGILLLEYNRLSKKEAAKEAKKEEEMKHISDTITDLYFTVQRQQTQLREMERIIYSISGDKPTVPPPVLKEPPVLVPPPTPPPTPATPEAPKQQNVSHQDTHNHNSIIVAATPYPNKGLILQSLNYIQTSSPFPNNNNNDILQATNKATEEKAFTPKREPAILSSALYNNIENNFRSFLLKPCDVKALPHREHSPVM